MVDQTLPNSRSLILWRGLTKRCPRCGGGNLFHHWFAMTPDCPRCGLHFEREPGYWTGAIAINTMVIGIAFVAVMIVFGAMTVPEIPWFTLLMLELPVMTLGPALFYPFSKTLWLGVDLAFLAHL